MGTRAAPEPGVLKISAVSDTATATENPTLFKILIVVKGEHADRIAEAYNRA